MINLPFEHPNCSPHNWVVYYIIYHYLSRFSDRLRGHLYDLGCGEKPYKEWLLNFVDKYIGVDWSNSLHEIEADILADLNQPLPIEDEVADTILSISVMEHLREPQVFLNEAYRILKKGGSIILQVPFMWWVHEAPYDFYRYTRYGLQYMFEKAGFADICIYPMTGFWVMWTLKLNYQTLRLIRGPWPLRKTMTLLMWGIWAIDQHIAQWLDRYWKCEAETAGYFVIAMKS